MGQMVPMHPGPFVCQAGLQPSGLVMESTSVEGGIAISKEGEASMPPLLFLSFPLCLSLDLFFFLSLSFPSCLSLSHLLSFFLFLSVFLFLFFLFLSVSFCLLFSFLCSFSFAFSLF